MQDLQSRKDIEKISMEILKQSKALDKFPTRVDLIVQHAELVFDNNIDLSKIDKNFIAKFSAGFTRFWDSVRGLLDREDKVIYVDQSQLPVRQNFVKLHEAGHHVLPWQSSVMKYMDTDETLNHAAKEEFEAEANLFASTTLFQLDRFTSMIDRMDLSISTGLNVGKVFGASTHATLRRMTLESKKRCALIVLETRQERSKKAFKECFVRDAFMSAGFRKEFGNLRLPDSFNTSDIFTIDYLYRRLKENGEITLNTNAGSADFEYHFWKNSYNGFVFLFPKGEKNKVRTHIHFTT